MNRVWARRAFCVEWIVVDHYWKAPIDSGISGQDSGEGDLSSTHNFYSLQISQPRVPTHSMGECTRSGAAAVLDQLARQRDAQVQKHPAAGLWGWWEGKPQFRPKSSITQVGTLAHKVGHPLYEGPARPEINEERK